MNKFSVCQFFDDDSYEFVRKYVSAEEAVAAMKHYTNCVGAQIGTTKRVIIVDDDDCINAEWIFGQGLVFRPPSKKEVSR